MAQGQITIGGKTYTKRHQVIPWEQTVTGAGVVPATLTFPGIAMFLLRGLTRDIVSAGAIVTATTRFRFKLGNSDGNIWYMTGPAGGAVFTDRVIDSAVFGTGQFIYVFDPAIPFGANASLRMEFEDITGINFPYTVFMGFQGCWLLP